MGRHVLFLAVVLGVCGGGPGAGEPASPPGLFPFVLPWDDASPGITDLSGWLERPAGRFGHVTVGTDGHLSVGGRRIRT